MGGPPGVQGWPHPVPGYQGWHDSETVPSPPRDSVPATVELSTLFGIGLRV